MLIKQKNQDEHINIIKEQYKQVQKIHNSRTDDLNSKLKILDKKYTLLEAKRNNEIEGFVNEINLIRKRMKSYENYVHNLKQMTIKGKDSIKLTEINNKLAETEEKYFNGTRTFKNDLDNFEQRLIENKNYTEPKDEEAEDENCIKEEDSQIMELNMI